MATLRCVRPGARAGSQAGGRAAQGAGGGAVGGVAADARGADATRPPAPACPPRRARAPAPARGCAGPRTVCVAGAGQASSERTGPSSRLQEGASGGAVACARALWSRWGRPVALAAPIVLARCVGGPAWRLRLGGRGLPYPARVQVAVRPELSEQLVTTGDIGLPATLLLRAYPMVRPGTPPMARWPWRGASGAAGGPLPPCRWRAAATGQVVQVLCCSAEYARGVEITRAGEAGRCRGWRRGESAPQVR